MNSQIEKKYDKIITKIMRCELCQCNGKDKKEGSDHIFKAEPANIGKNYGKGKKILIIGHVPYKKQKNEKGKTMNHNLKVYNSIRKYKQDSDDEDHINTWTISEGIKKYLKEILGHDDISYIAFTNCVKCQKENNGKQHVKDRDNMPSPVMYKKCIKLRLKKEIEILDPDIIILCGGWFEEFYNNLELGNSGEKNTARRIKLLNKSRIILNSYHPSYLTHWTKQKIGPKLIKENARKIKKHLNKN